MHHSIDRIEHTMAFGALDGMRNYSTMKDRSDDTLHHKQIRLPENYISLLATMDALHTFITKHINVLIHLSREYFLIMSHLIDINSRRPVTWIVCLTGIPTRDSLGYIFIYVRHQYNF